MSKLEICFNKINKVFIPTILKNIFKGHQKVNLHWFKQKWLEAGHTEVSSPGSICQCQGAVSWSLPLSDIHKLSKLYSLKYDPCSALQNLVHLFTEQLDTISKSALCHAKIWQEILTGSFQPNSNRGVHPMSWIFFLLSILVDIIETKKILRIWDLNSVSFSRGGNLKYGGSAQKVSREMKDPLKGTIFLKLNPLKQWKSLF